MTDVRRILTQILMEVTTEEIEKAVEETHKQFKKKGTSHSTKPLNWNRVSLYSNIKFWLILIVKNLLKSKLSSSRVGTCST